MNRHVYEEGDAGQPRVSSNYVDALERLTAIRERSISNCYRQAQGIKSRLFRSGLLPCMTALSRGSIHQLPGASKVGQGRWPDAKRR